MQILILDIETSPHAVYTFDLWDTSISPDKMISPAKMICWAAKWYNEKEMYFASFDNGPVTMLKKLHKLLDEADVVVHYNGLKFDIPYINREFIEHGFNPPSPYKQVDLYQIVKRNFKFSYNKLNYVASQLDIGEKLNNINIELWIGAMNKNPGSLKIMKNYNEQDVLLTERLYTKLLPWIEKHPNHGAYNDKQSCPKCGSDKFHKRGYSITAIARYIRYQCQSCGGWFRGNTNLRSSGDKTRNITS